MFLRLLLLYFPWRLWVKGLKFCGFYLNVIFWAIDRCINLRRVCVGVYPSCFHQNEITLGTTPPPRYNWASWVPWVISLIHLIILSLNLNDLYVDGLNWLSPMRVMLRSTGGPYTLEYSVDFRRLLVPCFVIRHIVGAYSICWASFLHLRVNVL